MNILNIYHVGYQVIKQDSYRKDNDKEGPVSRGGYRRALTTVVVAAENDRDVLAVLKEHTPIHEGEEIEIQDLRQLVGGTPILFKGGPKIDRTKYAQGQPDAHVARTTVGDINTKQTVVQPAKGAAPVAPAKGAVKGDDPWTPRPAAGIPLHTKAAGPFQSGSKSDSRAKAGAKGDCW